MDQTDTPSPACRHDGWTPERQALFLEHLAAHGNVRAACARVGLSREAAYRLRRREPLFARGWDAALLLARDCVADIFGDRATEGIEEEVWYRGEVVGTRRRHDNRLLLAHMARLDKLAEKQAPLGDAERFDEILACIAGEPVPGALAPDGDGLPPYRDAFVASARAEATMRVNDKWAEAANEHDELEDEAYTEFEAERDTEAERAELEAAALWDQWHARACAAVDALNASASSLGTVSTVSTSPPAPGDAR